MSSRLKQRADAGDPPPPGTRVVVARIQGEATEEEAAAAGRALVGLHGELMEPDNFAVEVVGEDGKHQSVVQVKTALVRLDGIKVPVHFGWDELELEDNYEEGSDAGSSGNG